MTVSKIHDYMTEKVVPESVMPQNIAACLMDDDPVVPELDAFTFLNRVRSLGIGSADFLYLLKGCGAPEEAVEKIENNPAMNLQTLIVTLESSGLTSQDYTRMLYTARQIWEKTLTVRLDKAKAAPANEEDDEDVYEETSPVSDKKEFVVNIPTDTDDYDSDYTSDEEYEEETEIPDEEYDHPDEEDNDVPVYKDVTHGRIGYQRIPREEDLPTNHSGKIVAASIGACVLLGLGVAMDHTDLLTAEVKLPAAVMALDHTEIFNDIYTAYTAGNFGGENVIIPSESNGRVFGELLITQPQELGVYNVGDSAFAAAPELITVYTEKDDNATVLCEISPPEGAEFIDIVRNKELLAAVFADENSVGVAAYNDNGEVLYTIHQAGVLTDICTNKIGTISFGTVFTPDFSQSFTIDQTEQYLPIIAAGGKVQTVPADRIARTESVNGCSYAVYGEYSLTDGSLVSDAAAIGDPVYSDAQKFMAVMKADSGYDIIIHGDSEDEPLITTHINDLIACDMGDIVAIIPSEDTEPYDSVIEAEREFNIVATAERESNGSTTIYLHSFDFERIAAVTNIPAAVTSIKMDQGMLYIYDENGVAMVLDVSDVHAPKIPELTAANGVIHGEYALCSNVTKGLLKLTLYKLEDNKATEAGSTTRAINSPEDELASMCNGNTFYIGEDRYAAAYTYFDGVSVISAYALFGRTNTSYTLFDDKNGFTAAVPLGNRLYLFYGNNAIKVE